MSEIGRARDHDELVDLLRARKEALGLSDQFVDDCCFDCRGHANQVLGPSRRKNLGRKSLDGLLITLGCALVLVEDPERIAFMAQQWERRAGYNVRPASRVSRAAVERAKPVIRAEFAASGAAARNAVLSSEQRAEIARRAANARWRKARAARRHKRAPRAAAQQSAAPAPA